LEQIYTSLQTNLTELDKEINLEFLKLKPVDQAEIRKDNKIRDLTEQITDKEKELKLITSRLKVILRSRSSSAANKEEREKKLTELFDDLPKNSQEFIDSLEKIKPELSKKVEKQEIEKLYQVNKELNELERVKDETLQTQIEIPAK
jgi:DNA repair exonuclease SbcCD ATPase subunit